MKGEQLNMFDKPEKMPMAEIIQFPVDREVVFVRETARLLTIKQGSAAERFWQMTCRRLYARLQVQGLKEAEIRLQLASFSHAVHAQMQQTAWAAWESDNPKGAA